MIIGEIIAAYAAIVATAAVIFQIRQARRARKPQVELELTESVRVRALKTDRVETCHMVSLEIRNRGDYPIRVMDAGIASSDMRYEFRPQETQIICEELFRESGSFLTVSIEVTDEGTEHSLLPLPGIILPRDSASRRISSCMIPTKGAAKADRDLYDKYRREIHRSLSSELYGWVEISTGEVVKMKPVRLKMGDLGNQ